MSQPYGIYRREGLSYYTNFLHVDLVTVGVVMAAVGSILRAVTMFLFFGALALIMDWKITLTLVTSGLLVSTVGMRVVFKVLRRIEMPLRDSHNLFNKTFHQMLSIFKPMKFTQDHYFYEKLSASSRRMITLMPLKAAALSQLKPIVEMSFLFCAVAAYLFAGANRWILSDHIAVLTVVALQFYRLMPVVSEIVGSFGMLISYSASLDKVSQVLYHGVVERLGDEKVKFEKEIALRNTSLTFEYSQAPVLSEVNLSIQKGEKIALIGRSGAGKTTLADIICTLYPPTHGGVYVDGQLLSERNYFDWRQKIAYLSQNPLLAGDTVLESILMGRAYDKERISELMRWVGLEDFEESGRLYEQLNDGGEQQNLSGGQKQRIALVRALYGNPDLLVLDEPTSALDMQTESDVAQRIYETDHTVVIIAHRISTIYGCNAVYEIRDGRVVKLTNEERQQLHEERGNILH